MHVLGLHPQEYVATSYITGASCLVLPSSIRAHHIPPGAGVVDPLASQTSDVEVFSGRGIRSSRLQLACRSSAPVRNASFTPRARNGPLKAEIAREPPGIAKGSPHLGGRRGSSAAMRGAAKIRDEA